jgi:hypothetical protein
MTPSDHDPASDPYAAPDPYAASEHYAADWREVPRGPDGRAADGAIDTAAGRLADEWGAPGIAEHPALGALAEAKAATAVSPGAQRRRLERALARELNRTAPDMLFVARLRRAAAKLKEGRAAANLKEEAVRSAAGPVPRAGDGSTRGGPLRSASPRTQRP